MDWRRDPATLSMVQTPPDHTLDFLQGPVLLFSRRPNELNVNTMRLERGEGEVQEDNKLYIQLQLRNDTAME